MPRPVALAALLAAAMAVGTPVYAQVVVGAPASGIQVAPGGQVTVPVVVDMTGSGGFSLGSLTAQLSWKPSTLRFTGATGGAFGTPTVNPDSASGTLQFAVANPAGATGQVVVLQATFDATGPSGDTTYLNLAVSQLTSAVSFTDLTPVTTSSLLCVGTASGVWGDLDNSGTVTSFDALLIVTYAVGLPIAPNSPALGDVDADGQVTTRDALIVLTYVVSLPTPGFRPGQPVAGACGGPPPKTVTALPTSVALVVGDTVGLTAVAQDSLGQVTSTPGFAWTSLDPLVATVTASGSVAAVGAGVTGAVVAVAPGVMDTVAVTVATTRTLWYVDVAAAAQNQQETGSPSYPFSTLQQAVNRAAVDDTIYVRGGSYGTGAQSAKPLTITGEPGYPAPRFGGPIAFDSIGAATVRLGRLVVADAPFGVRVTGLGGGLLILDSVGVERALGHGIEIANFDSVSLRDVAVQGAVDKGLITSDVRAHALAHVTVDGVSMAGGQGTGRAVYVLRSQSFAVDTGAFQLGSVKLDTVTAVRLHYVAIGQTTDAPFELTGGATVDFDTVSVRFSTGSSTTGFAVALGMQPGGIVTGRETEIKDTDFNGLLVAGGADVHWQTLNVQAGGSSTAAVAAGFLGTGRVTIRQSSFTGGLVAQLDSAGFGNATMLQLDTVTFDYAPLLVNALDTVSVRGAIVRGGGYGSGALVEVDNTPLVSLVGVEATGSAATTPAVIVTNGDSLRADSLYVHDNAGTAVQVTQFRTASLSGGRFERNATAYAYSGIVQLLNVAAVRVAQGVFEEISPVTSLEWNTSLGAGQTLTVDTTVFRGSGQGISAYTYGYAGRVIVRGSTLERGPAGYGRQLVYASMPGWVQVLDSRIDSTDYGYFAIQATTDTLDVVSTQMHFVGSGITGNSYSGTGLLSTLTGNTIACRTGNSSNYYGISLSNPQVVATGNTVNGCVVGLAFGGSPARTAIISGNTITTLDSLNGQGGIQLSGDWRQSVISANTISGGRMSYAGIYIAAGSAIDTLRVDSNLVEDGFGKGIYVYGLLRGSRLYGNTIQRMRPLSPAYDAAIYAEYGYGTDTLVISSNRLLQNRSMGMYLAFGSGGAPMRVDTNVVVDDSLAAIHVDQGSKVVGRANFLARNQDGLYGYGTITIDSSVIQQSTRAGAEAAGGGILTMIDNYWGDPSGPRCDTNCAALGALGDSIINTLSVAYFPFLTSAPSTPVGAPPALRPVSALRVPTSLARPRAVEAAWFERLRRSLHAPRATGGAR